MLIGRCNKHVECVEDPIGYLAGAWWGRYSSAAPQKKPMLHTISVQTPFYPTECT